MGWVRVFVFSLFLFFSFGARDDPLLKDAWNLHSIKSEYKGHMSILDSWNLGFTGYGVLVAFSNRRPSLKHQEFLGRFSETASYHSTDNTVEDSSTRILSSFCGNAFNNVCSAGVAYNAQFSILGQRGQFLREFAFMSLRNADIYVVDNNGFEGHQTKCATCLQQVKKITERGSAIVATTGIGGHESNCNLDQYANQPLMISVGSHDAFGHPADYAPYCSSTLISGPGGTASHRIPVASGNSTSCTFDFGSEFAVAQIAGVVALMYEATYGDLPPREIAHILVMSSSIPEEVSCKENGAGLRFHPQIGFGNLDAKKALLYATRVLKKPPLYFLDPFIYSDAPEAQIQDMTTTVASFQCETSIIYFVDWAHVDVVIDHAAPGDLKLSLISPQGTESVLINENSINQNLKKLIVFDVFEAKAVALNEAAEEFQAGQDAHILTFDLSSNCCWSSQCKFSNTNLGEGLKVLLLRKQECSFSDQIENVLHSFTPDVVFIDSKFVSTAKFTMPILSLEKEDFADLLYYTSYSIPKPFQVVPLEEKYRLDYSNWGFTSAMFWGEEIDGEWKLVIVDQMENDEGILHSATLTLYSYAQEKSEDIPDNTQQSETHCCYYETLVDALPSQCLELSNCFEVPNYVLQSDTIMVGGSCNNCASVVVPTPTQIFNTCCWYFNERREHQCLRQLTGTCPTLSGFELYAHFLSIDAADCDDFCS